MKKKVINRITIAAFFVIAVGTIISCFMLFMNRNSSYPSLRITGNGSHSFQNFHYEGTITNYAMKTARNVRIEVSFYDADNTLIERETEYIGDIPANTSKTISIYVPLPTQEAYSVTVEPLCDH